ncbi:endonuclease [Melioribacteraceae bacterium 4301-Me]|uniref:endonuclease/exonuclease/phosphatase family protein n=1 Tax=Pyranulibacter aquaticus TaxID=3163344 RepID=UPI00359929C5
MEKYLIITPKINLIVSTPFSSRLNFLIVWLLILFFFGPVQKVFSQHSNSNKFIYIANWNVENLFDTIDDTTKNDDEFLPSSKKKWTEEKFLKKIDNLSQVIHFMNDGKGPDIIGLEEVENMSVMKFIVYKFTNRDYIIVHRDSPDPRGIDVGLIYDRNIFDILHVNKIPVLLPNNEPTRDILHVTLKYKHGNDSLHIFVNHWPSRRTGKETSEVKRNTAAQILKEKVDSVLQIDTKNKIIILGDFNDEPIDNSILDVLKADTSNCSDLLQPADNKLYNLAYHDYKLKLGTYLYKNNWNLLDQIIISGSLLNNNGISYFCDSFEIIKPDFMKVDKESDVSGPIPTYIGNKYIGGYSDHFPVGALFKYLGDK